MDAEVIVRFYNSTGTVTWLIIEGELRDNDDWELFGYCRVGEQEWKWQSVMLSELKRMRLIRRDRGLVLPKKVRDKVF